MMMTQNHTLEDDVYEDEDEGDLAQEDGTLLYFEGLVSRDEVARASWIDRFGRSLKTWATRADDPSARKLLQVHLPTALRFTVNSPFKDVRSKLRQALDELKKVSFGDGMKILCPSAIHKGWRCSYKYIRGFVGTVVDQFQVLCENQ